MADIVFRQNGLENFQTVQFRANELIEKGFSAEEITSIAKGKNGSLKLAGVLLYADILLTKLTTKMRFRKDAYENTLRKNLKLYFHSFLINRFS